MSKADNTRQKIVEHAAELFNVQGYSGTAISDIMDATGLKKGGIYAHFSSKEEIAVAAFDFAYECSYRRYREIIEAYPDDALKQLLEVVESHRYMDTESPVDGGCPLLNTAIESDDYHPTLKRRAQAMMRQWQSVIRYIVKNGIAAGQFRKSVDASQVATLIISSLEGSLMMSKLMDEPAHLRFTVDWLLRYIKEEIAV